MREIKFRAYDGKKMYLPEYSNKEDFHLLADGTIVETNEHGYERHELTSKRGGNWIVMQYTGLRDRNGKEIYEGDIVIRYGTNSSAGKVIARGEVKWFESQAAFSFDERGIWNIGIYTKAINLLEVIGNIYENPELLNQ